MQRDDLKARYASSEKVRQVISNLAKPDVRTRIQGAVGSAISFIMAACMEHRAGCHLVVMDDQEAAAYQVNDFQALLNKDLPVYYLPPTHKKPYDVEETENANISIRTEVLNALSTKQDMVIVTYGDALAERVLTQKELEKNTFLVQVGEKYSLDYINEVMIDLEFEKVDYVHEPGQFAMRGGIVDIFSFVNERPFRIEMFGEEVESIRVFDPITQLSDTKMVRLSIVPNIEDNKIVDSFESFFKYLPDNSVVWMKDLEFAKDRVGKELAKAEKAFKKLKSLLDRKKPEELYLSGDELAKDVSRFRQVFFGSGEVEAEDRVTFKTSPQPLFNKKFELLTENFRENRKRGLENVIVSGNAKQIERLYNIFQDIGEEVEMSPILMSLKQGYVDEDVKAAVYTDHQIFERYNRFRLKEGFKRTKEALTIQDLIDLKPGDYVTHIDHGIGEFSGLEKIDVNGKLQEAIRLKYRDNDILYVSIHSLHRIAKYTGKEGTVPKIHKLGSGAWEKVKAKTKSRVKTLAFNLIELYAKRKAAKGFAYAPDTYLQTELEAGFMYEDTPDQEKATIDFKKDMENEMPMDRLICGDVGFGKTEIAIRAAFKAVADNKQVAILVPTTVLCFQHYQSFSARLKDFPASVDYVNRFRTAKEQTAVLKNLAAGKLDIIIGTHKLLSKKTEFFDLGLLIIDEEQKFGVGAKDKLKNFKANVDTLTLTATPIPRTLQFSLMGARDLSIIKTPPPNRYPVETKIIPFSEPIIRDAIFEELKRGGQVFFVHNRIQTIEEIAGMIQRLCPESRICIGHGQMDGKKLEQVMLDFIDGAYDVLVSTTIIESGLDIPNANTMIINDAQNYGLSDMHQLRGRVGRSNRKAHCYLIAPPMHHLSTDSRKRLEAITQFSDLGSGINIAMRDLDIRGAGDLLGAEQSGFISDIGFDTYQKILNEAVNELKETQFKELFAQERAERKEYVQDVYIDTDLEILLPDDYVQGTAERLKLYRELESIKDQKALDAYVTRLIDRFGEPPRATKELMSSLSLKWMGKELGMEKIILKGGKMICHFIADQESPFYSTSQFTAILRFIQKMPAGYKMYERNDTLRLSHQEVSGITDAIAKLEPLKSLESVTN
jgi:transcription-repair coupling factor (superfamily II helicase)